MSRAPRCERVRATLRLQFHARFTLDDARRRVPYFAALGVSHLYASPLLAAQPGSSHGYDGIAHDRINPELGDEAALRALVAELRAHGMGLLLDIVPNHMAASLDNPWWHDVLELGQASEFAEWFDIDWEAGGGRLLLPWLPAPLGDLVAEADLALRWDGPSRRLYLHSGALRVPLSAAGYARALAPPTPRGSGVSRDTHREAIAAHAAPTHGPESCGSGVSRDTRREGIAAHAAPTCAVGVLRQLGERFAEAKDRAGFDAARDALAAALAADPTLHSALDAALERFLPVDEAGRMRLRSLLDAQPWRLADWRAAPRRINWRRFFDIGALVALRMERPEVFEAVHAYPLSLFAQGLVDGLRIDHVDGLRDPAGYCRRLRAELDRLTPQRPPEAPRRGVLLVEKILAGDEPLRADWGVDGSTGYDFMEQLGALLHDPAGEPALDAAWQALGGPAPFRAVALQARRETLQHGFDADFRRVLSRVAGLLPELDREALGRALHALLLQLPVYRTYLTATACAAEDRRLLQDAATAARAGLDAAAAAALDRLLERACNDPGSDPGARADALAALQQLSPPIAAKAIEDTAFYRYGRLLSRNEVGSDPGRLSLPAAAFHAHCVQRARDWPGALLATATHDHKRGEDVRARLAVLSGCADWWRLVLGKWLARSPAGWPGGRPLPQAEDRAMLFQTLLGAWPPALQPDDASGLRQLGERVAGWQRKALREAGLRSSWTSPDADYEAACARFLQAWLDDAGCRALLQAALARIAPAGALNGLAQVLLRCTAPGVPDLYQGTELWDHSLVDPDNRRPVDFDLRARFLAEPMDAAALLQDWRSGRIKLALLVRALAARRRCPTLFAEGEYLPLAARGRHAANVFAFLRRHGDAEALVVVPLRAASLLGDTSVPQVPPAAWADTVLEGASARRGRWFDLLGNAPVELHEGILPLQRVLHDWPVALWLRE